MASLTCLTASHSAFATLPVSCHSLKHSSQSVDSVSSQLFPYLRKLSFTHFGSRQRLLAKQKSYACNCSAGLKNGEEYEENEAQDVPFSVRRRDSLLAIGFVWPALTLGLGGPALAGQEYVSKLCSSIGRDSEELVDDQTVSSNVPILPLEVCSWERFRGDGFALRVPPGFEDIMPEPVIDDTPKSTLGDGKPQSPFVARFASPDRQEVLSVVVRPTTSLKLSFFEVKDVTDFGSITEASKILLPPGARVLASRQYSNTPEKVARNYYLYEFIAQGMHVALGAAVAKGQVYVVGATTPEEQWRAAASRLRTSVKAFSLVI